MEIHAYHWYVLRIYVYPPCQDRWAVVQWLFGDNWARCRLYACPVKDVVLCSSDRVVY